MNSLDWDVLAAAIVASSITNVAVGKIVTEPAKYLPILEILAGYIIVRQASKQTE